MGVRILYNSSDGMATIYCSTTDIAFGPVFYDGDNHEADERAEAFIKWLPQDARRYTDTELMQQYTAWLAQEDAFWKREDAPKCDDCDEPIPEGQALCAACLQKAMQ